MPKRLMERPVVMCIGGHDPSAGAGVLADCKTCEQLGAYGFGVCSGITFQSDICFVGVEWLPFSTILAQVEPLLNRFEVKVAKIGVMQDLSTIVRTATWLRTQLPNIRIVWDPVLGASTGYTFHHTLLPDQVRKILRLVDIVTPNRLEVLKLMPTPCAEESARQLASFCDVFLKGGHASGERVQDVLFSAESQSLFEGPREKSGDKHGSGCVVAAAIAAHLAHGLTLHESCAGARRYIEKLLRSSPGLLGYHSGESA